MTPSEELENLQKTGEEVPLSNFETLISNLVSVIYAGLSVFCFGMFLLELWLGAPFTWGLLSVVRPEWYELDYHLVGIPIFFLFGCFFLIEFKAGLSNRNGKLETLKIISRTILFILILFLIDVLYFEAFT